MTDFGPKKAHVYGPVCLNCERTNMICQYEIVLNAKMSIVTVAKLVEGSVAGFDYM